MTIGTSLTFTSPKVDVISSRTASSSLHETSQQVEKAMPSSSLQARFACPRQTAALFAKPPLYRVRVWRSSIVAQRIRPPATSAAPPSLNGRRAALPGGLSQPPLIPRTFKRAPRHPAALPPRCLRFHPASARQDMGPALPDRRRVEDR